MNKYPFWKYLIILAVIIPGFLYALPNLFGEDPALQISATRSAVIDVSTENQLKNTLNENGIPFISLQIREVALFLSTLVKPFFFLCLFRPDQSLIIL